MLIINNVNFKLNEVECSFLKLCCKVCVKQVCTEHQIKEFVSQNLIILLLVFNFNGKEEMNVGMKLVKEEMEEWLKSWKT